ncbi:MAG: hypothetical protein KatS3mg124_2065 [Porticoccaceae bacterium]|nr:MAG: hypothetical protein KatS3mg124_2065 [Porticoccaceae bacterium]
MPPPSRWSLCCALAWALAASPTHGADYSHLPLAELVDLEVFSAASLLPTAPGRAPATVYVFRRDDLARLHPRTLGELAELVPGIQTNQYRKRHTALWSRGLINRYNDKMVLLLDGVRLADFYYGALPSGDELPLDQMERVEVVLGPASSLHGANALAGVVSLTTRDVHGAELRALAGNFASRRAALALGEGGVQLYASALSRDLPYHRDRQSFAGDRVVVPAAEDYATLHLKARPRPSLRLAARYGQWRHPFAFIPATQDAFVEGERLDLSARWQLGDALDRGLELALDQGFDRAREWEEERRSGALAYREVRRAHRTHFAATGRIRLGNHLLTAGLTADREVLDRVDALRLFRYDLGFLQEPQFGDLLRGIDREALDGALFVQDLWQPNPDWTLVYGARRDHLDRYGDPFNHRLAAVWTGRAGHSLKFLYGTALRAPSLRERFKNLESDFAAPPLNPERLTSWEVAWNHRRGPWELQGSAYRQRVEDLIAEVPTPDGADEYFANREGNARIRGVELLLAHRGAGPVGVRAALGLLDADGADPSPGPYLAPWTGSLHLDWRWNAAVEIDLVVRFTGRRRDRNGFADDDPGGRLLFDASASGPLGGGFSWRLAVRNLADARSRDPAADFGAQYNPEGPARELWLEVFWTGRP